MSNGFVTRFAPSPTGYLHRGHAYSAITAARAAGDANGAFLLRIDNIDAQRSRSEFETAIAEDLAWLGLSWETPVHRQSEHIEQYQEALRQLRRDGLIYPCRRTRRDVIDRVVAAPQEGDRPDEQKSKASEGPVAWRLSLAAATSRLGELGRLSFIEEGGGPGGETGEIAVDAGRIGDVILGRRDVGVSYHLAVVVDDANQRVSHVIRGNDLFGATHVHRVLQALLNLPTPIYRHHRLVLRADGKRFAKRDTAETLRDVRSRGVSPSELLDELGI